MSKQSSQRLPAPTLFVGPRSHNASNSSLPKHTQSSNSIPSAAIPGPGTPLTNTNTRDSLQKAGLSRVSTNATYKKDERDRENNSTKPNNSNNNNNNNTEAAAVKQGGEKDGGVGTSLSASGSATHKRPRRGTAVLDAHWAALQSTLSDIELSASSSSHVFGSTHASSLEDLRTAQVELARAWAESSLDSNADTSDDKPDEKHISATEREKEDKARKGSVGNTGVEEAAKRREISDRYFERVKQGVGEVVGKLEVVGLKMRAVEMQSREIWGEGHGSDATSLGTESRTS